MKPTREIEDQVILTTLEALERGELPRVADPEQDESTETLARLYTEVWGLIPYELAAEAEAAQPVARSIKSRVLAAAGAVPAAAPPVAEHPRFAARRQAREPAAPTAVAGRAFGRRVFALAAAMTFLLIGLASFSAWLFVELDDQRTVIAQMSRELDQAREQRGLAGQRELVGALRSLSVLSATEVEVCPLRPVGEKPPQPQARGMLFMVDEKGRWHLHIRDLAPVAPGQAYQLWFLAGDQPVKRVPLDPSPSGEIRLTASDLPMPMDAAAITLEPSFEVDRPTGPRILYGHAREMDRL